MFGRNPSIPEDLLQENPTLAVSESITCGDASAQANAVRQAARKAVLECQDDKALRAALRARPRVFHDFKSGDWVYYWRSQKWDKGVLINDGRWYGPALTLGLVGRNIMVAHRRNILRCAPEHVRHVTEEEKTVVESPDAELLGIKTLLSQGQFPKNQFVDLVMQTSPPDPSVCVNGGAAPAPEVSRAPNAAEVVREARESETADAPQWGMVGQKKQFPVNPLSMVLFVGDIISRVNKIPGIEKLLHLKDRLVRCWFDFLDVILRTLPKCCKK